jgi:hypothetical protein
MFISMCVKFKILKSLLEFKSGSSNGYGKSYFLTIFIMSFQNLI